MTTPGSVGESIQLLPWLTGVSRDTGTPVNDPSSQTDLRNIEWFQGAVRLRSGMGDAVNALASPVVCAVQVFKAYGLLCWVLYDPADRSVIVVSTNLQGQSETAVGTWGTLDASADSPPRFTMAESFGILIFAHDEPNVTNRLQTFAFDPAAGTPWHGIEADLDGSGDEPIYFRGVVTHLNAVWGWGFGTDSDPDRPEVIRRSNPDDPEIYDAETFFQIGVRADPIIACAPVGSILAILKGSSWWRLAGQTSADFEPSQADSVVGIVGCNSLQNVNGLLYWWSPYGPKRTDGSVTVDLSQALDLTGPLPAELPTFGPGAYCWTYCDPDTLSLGFAFPNPADPEQERTSAWKASLVEAPRWSLDVFERTVLCGVLATTGQASVTIDPGHADDVTVAGASGAGEASATVTWENIDCVGDETVEIWARINTGIWFLSASVPVETHSHPQSTVLTSGMSNGTIDVALRHRRLNRYDPLYVSTDPEDWPSISRATGMITAVATPAITACAYDTVTQRLNLVWTMATSSADIEVELDIRAAEPSAMAGASLGLRTTTLAPGTLSILATTVGPTGSLSLPANQWQSAAVINSDLLSIARTRGYYMRCRVRGFIGAIYGNWSSASECFIGYGTVGTLVGGGVSFNVKSVASGTNLRWQWTNAADATGATQVQTLGTIVVRSDPANSGSCDAVFNTDNRVLNLNTIAASPQIVAAPNCSTCLIVPQTVAVTLWEIRNIITKAGVAHWTQVSTPTGATSTEACTP